MPNELSAVTNSGQQLATGSPQTAGKSTGGGTQSSGVQPGTSPSLLNGQGSIPLSNQAVTTVSLNGTSASTQASPAVAQPKHHVNAPLLGVSAVLLIAAIIMFWLMTRSAKNTT